MHLKHVFGIVLLSALLFGALPAHATDQQDLAVALKTLPLLTDKITGPANVAIIYDPASAESRSDAEAIKSAFDDGLEAPGEIQLIPQLVNTGELSRLSAAKIAFMAHMTPRSDYDAISSAASAAGVLTICTDLECVKANKCILGVVSKPQVEVYYSPVAAEKARISFASAFTMLAKQVGSM